jgi:16S rRNA (cytosine967-C5)-methyltransferase
MPRPATSARELAFVALEEYRMRGTFIAQALDTEIARGGIPPEHRPLATEIAIGVVRRQATLDAILQPLVRRPREQVEPGLWTLMRIGAYQLVFLAVPSHAAVHETVEVARRIGQPRWTGFLNGVLRSVDRLATGEETATPAADAVPVGEQRYRRLKQPVFADPQQDPAGYFAAAFSFPAWLVDRWQRRFSFEQLLRMGSWFNTPPAVALRINTLRTTREAYLKSLAASGIEAGPGELPEAVRLVASIPVERLPGFAEGWFAVQDESAMRAARLLDARPGQRVLDLCAAPGTKTTHVAELMRNEGQIVATDVNPDRLARVDENCRRLGVRIVDTQVIGEDAADAPAGPFDAILLDVPCSNTGVLGKRPEARWRITPQDINELPQIQRRLAVAACERVRAGGRIVYSTCSIEPEENAAVVRWLLDRDSRFRLAAEQEYLPGRPADGAYQALIRRLEG